MSNETNPRRTDDSANNSNPSHAIHSANYCCDILLAEYIMPQSSNHKYICFVQRKCTVCADAPRRPIAAVIDNSKADLPGETHLTQPGTTNAKSNL
jgi:hypothetical protein